MLLLFVCGMWLCFSEYACFCSAVQLLVLLLPNIIGDHSFKCAGALSADHNSHMGPRSMFETQKITCSQVNFTEKALSSIQ